MKRRSFLKTSLLSAGTLITGNQLLAGSLKNPPPVNKRERMLQWLAGKSEPGYTPAAFFLHFDAAHKVGDAAATRHLEYFRYTDMILSKSNTSRNIHLLISSKSLQTGRSWSQEN